jgi:hypothetical protein
MAAAPQLKAASALTGSETPGLEVSEETRPPETAAKAPAPAAATPKREEERRASLNTEWYIEMDPATSIIAAGTKATFRLRNTEGATFGWSCELPELGHSPVFTLSDDTGERKIYYTHGDLSPGWITFSKAGHYRAAFRGHPQQAAGGDVNPWALVIPGSEVLVSVDFDVLADLTPETLAGPSVQATAARDMEHLEDPQATEGEIAAAFQRLAVRRGLDALEANRQEAEEQLALYTKGTEGRTAAQATDELKRIVDLDEALQREWSRLHPSEAMLSYAQKRGRIVRSLDDLIAFVHEEQECIALGRAALVEAFPALAVVTHNPELRTLFERSPEKRQGLIEFGLRHVLSDIETTKRNLASGDLSILRVGPIVADARRALAIDGDARKAKAVDRLLKEHGAEESTLGLAVAGATILLLFIPGIGPYLAATVGAGWAARSWVRAGELRAAAGAGVREGLVSRGEAGAAAFWAVLDTLFAGLDLGGALGAASKIVPHVPEAAARLAERSAGGAAAKVLQGGAKAEGLLPEIAAVGKGEKPLSMTAGELTDLAARLFRRPVKPMAGEVHFYETMEKYTAEFKRYWPDRPVPAGYRNPNTGHIHISPQAGLMTAIHEAVHKVARETFPMGRQVLGPFLDEGITEAITRASLGPRAGAHAYDPHVAFVEFLQRRLGEDVVKNAVLHGDYRSLRDAVKRLLGGSELKTFEFFKRVRSIGSDAKGVVENRQALEEATAMLEGTGGAKAAIPSPAVKPPAPVAPPPKHGLPELEPGSGRLEGPFGARTPGSKSRYWGQEEDIVKDIAEKTGKVPIGTRALEEAGVTARSLPRIDEHHHLLVQQLRKWFRQRGVNIDDFTMKLSADEHRWIHNEYRWNDLWKDFRLKNPKASPDEILTKMAELQKQVGLEGLKIVPYPK